MPLRDHFRPPLSTNRHWESFHSLWTAEIVRQFNRHILPPGYVAENQVHIGVQLEVDVGTFEGAETVSPTASANGSVALHPWAPPATALVVPAVFPDVIEVRILSTDDGPTLVAAIDFVSPGNKDRPESRPDFVAKCITYLRSGVGLVIVDVVTSSHANLHDDLMAALGHPPAVQFPVGVGLYATAYRPSQPAGVGQIELWLEALAVGNRLPVMPLALRGGPTLPLHLEATYIEVLMDLRLPP